MNTNSPRETKAIPTFRNESEERAFWKKHDVTEYFDLSTAIQASFVNLKPSNDRSSEPGL
jgi:hypothetical protein